MSQFQQDIKQFNGMYKLPVASEPSLEQLGVDVLQRLADFKDILREELEEVEAIHAMVNCLRIGALFNPQQFDLKDTRVPFIPEVLDVLTAIADWLGDIQVFAASEMAKYGLPLDGILAIIMNSNFSKMGSDGKPIYDARGKLQKGPDYWKPEPMIKKLLVGHIESARILKESKAA